MREEGDGHIGFGRVQEDDVEETFVILGIGFEIEFGGGEGKGGAGKGAEGVEGTNEGG